jgi:Na+-translocating ferredoxin:NAD+ oxidoreductase RnfD subunit
MTVAELDATQITIVPRNREPAARSLWREAVRFIRSPKGVLLIALGLLAAIAGTTVGLPRVAVHIGSAMLAAAAIDVCLTLWTRDEWMFPSGAMLTGLIVALILSPTGSPSVAALTSIVAIASKYLFRTRWSNVFNPAALALVVAYFAFGAQESWWGALPDLPVVSVALLIAVGVFIADRVNKLPMVLVFLASFFGLFAVGSCAFDPAGIPEIFRSPDANATLFLALFMLDDPPTSPVRYGDQVRFALIAAVASCAAFALIGAVYFLPAGVLVANAWESLRRVRERAARAARAVTRAG